MSRESDHSNSPLAPKSVDAQTEFLKLNTRGGEHRSQISIEHNQTSKVRRTSRRTVKPALANRTAKGIPVFPPTQRVYQPCLSRIINTSDNNVVVTGLSGHRTQQTDTKNKHFAGCHNRSHRISAGSRTLACQNAFSQPLPASGRFCRWPTSVVRFRVVLVIISHLLGKLSEIAWPPSYWASLLSMTNSVMDC